MCAVRVVVVGLDCYMTYHNNHAKHKVAHTQLGSEAHEFTV